MGTIRQLLDGAHTFAELYEHRHPLWLVLCKFLRVKGGGAWRAKRHHKASHIEGSSCSGMESSAAQISYHLPVRFWGHASFAATVFAPSWEYDRHGFDEILIRLHELEP